MTSLAERLRARSPATINKLLGELTDLEAAALETDWDFWARPNQLPPEGDWTTWLLLGGRGSGKTRAGAECVRRWVKDYALVNLIGPTAEDARDVLIEGESGLLNICPNSERPTYLPSRRRLEWPNGAVSLIFTAEEPDRLRGKQHMKLWADEVCAWSPKKPKMGLMMESEAWDQAELGLRLGNNPQAVVTTTPKPVKMLLNLMEHPNTITTKATTYENQGNLSPKFIDQIIRRFEGTRQGRQELLGEVLRDVPGALWRLDWFDSLRVTADQVPELRRVVVAIDPAVTSSESSDLTGIAVVGKGVAREMATLEDRDGHGYVLADRSLKASPHGWASAAVAAYEEFHADLIVAEANNGGDLVEFTLRTVAPHIPFKKLHASRGKVVRAEPIAALYEQGKVHHVGAFPELEDELCTFVPGGSFSDSPDRADAVVWALTELFLAAQTEAWAVAV
ncbi:hypothetical protein LCGC14_1542900 [marine sediment metagenome]|uniref:Terminase large subunit gp17-like C-terminal domain-containing protein n=1 Tax=marine sediment metagenome TaxID=412755 RepID=A0A0F9JDG1_9ZZZZ